MAIIVKQCTCNRSPSAESDVLMDDSSTKKQSNFGDRRPPPLFSPEVTARPPKNEGAKTRRPGPRKSALQHQGAT